MRSVFLLFMLSLMVACSEPAPDTGASAAPQEAAMTPASEEGVNGEMVSEADESEALTVWLDEQFAEQLDFSPQWKTRLGDKSDYGQLDDPSEAADEQELTWRRNSVAEMQATFTYDLLSEDAMTSWDTWVYSLERA
jgi:hypothetical protein